MPSEGKSPFYSFKPKPLRSTNNMAERACHVVGSTTRFGLTQVLDRMGTISTNGRMAKRGLTLSRYIRRRNGVPAGARGSLRNMLYRSLGAPTFAGFWRHWNPVFGYALGRYVFAPLKRVVPSELALVATFVVCGAIHDLVTMAARGAPAFLFTPWFFLLGIGVLLGHTFGLNLSDKSWSVRAAVNLGYVSVCWPSSSPFATSWRRLAA